LERSEITGRPHIGALLMNVLPTQGVLKGPRLHKDHLVQYWLRLPLGPVGASRAQMILGHDHFAALPVTELRELQRRLK